MLEYFKTAEKGNHFVLTEKGYEKTSSKVKLERKIGEPIKGFEHRVHVSWIEKGYVKEIKCGKPESEE